VIGKYHRFLINSAKGTRLLALLLLASIAWGTTAEVTHHHGASGRSSALQVTASEDQSPSQRVESPDNERSSKRTTTRDECLICQLHQNLFATVFSHSLHTTPATKGILCNHVALIPYSSQSKTPQKGRAPPSNL
jgi:hypothetical protein